MTIRSDVSVDWSLSPRILTIAAPSTEITVQDIVDTCRNFEDLSPNSSMAKLIDAAGKEFLGGTTYVGITATLQNAVLAFEKRLGPGWILCTITGGNIVAVDHLGAVIDPRHPTAFTTIDRTASASATLQEQSAIQYASFSGSTTIDVLNGVAGTEYPIGTRETPVNNITDALTIATTRGFEILHIHGDLTLAAGDNVDGYIFEAHGYHKTFITVDAAATTTGCEFIGCGVTGTISGDNKYVDCWINDLHNANGEATNCRLTGTIYIDGGADAVFMDCGTAVPGVFAIIDMGGSGQNAMFHDWSGGIKVVNMDGASNMLRCQMDGGLLEIDSTVSAGRVIAIGIGLVTDNSTGTTVVNTEGLMSKEGIADDVWDEDLTEHTNVNTAGKIVQQIKSIVGAILGLIS